MSKYFQLLLAEIANIESIVHRQYVLAEVLAEIKSLESINRDKLAAIYNGDAKFSDEYFTVVVKTPDRIEVNQAKVIELFQAGWDPETVKSVFPVKYGLNKKELAKKELFNYAIIHKQGKSTVKVTRNQD
jgi:hypothetical protein